MPDKAERKKQFAKFKEEREMQLHLYKILKIQALVRGFIARKRIVPSKKIKKVAVREIADSFIQNYIEEVYIPDLLLEIITMNKATENFGLYSTRAQALMEIRHKIITEVVREEVKLVAREYINRFID